MLILKELSAYIDRGKFFWEDETQLSLHSLNLAEYMGLIGGFQWLLEEWIAKTLADN